MGSENIEIKSKKEENLILSLISGIFAGAIWFFILCSVRGSIVKKSIENNYSLEFIKWLKAYSTVFILFLSFCCFMYFFSGQNDE